IVIHAVDKTAATIAIADQVITRRLENARNGISDNATFDVCVGRVWLSAINTVSASTREVPTDRAIADVYIASKVQNASANAGIGIGGKVVADRAAGNCRCSGLKAEQVV